MNNYGLRKIMYIAITFLVIFIVIRLFMWMLPFLLIGGLVLYVLSKTRGFFSKKKEEENTSYSYTYNSNSENNEYSEESVDTSSAIDVDYEDIDN